MILRCCVEPSNTFLYINDSPRSDGKREAMLVDCSAPPETVKRACAERNAEIKYIVLTHGHYDHVTTFEEVRKAFPEALTVCHKFENATLTDVDANVSYLFDDPRVFTECEKTVGEGDLIVLKGDKVSEDGSAEDGSSGDGSSGDGNATFKVIHTPGHTPGCICLYCEKDGIMFTGDTVFADGGIGRTDFKGGSMSILSSSLKRLSEFNDGIIILPGHGRTSTVGEELYYF
ncbi:MAG: MBL fold metallo-hydrolase [Clostridia bacterium]|nr:MBL fold metallo-hydrolase [Clostridia bacterium]